MLNRQFVEQLQFDFGESMLAQEPVPEPQLNTCYHTNNAELNTDEGEQWRPIDGYHFSYEVSSYGRVRSLGRRIRVERDGKRFSYDRPGRLRKPSLH